MAMVRPRFSDARAELFESKFGVITGSCGLGDLCLSLRIQPGEKNGGLHLGAGHGHVVMDGAKLTTVDFERGKIVVLGANVGAHLAKRGDNALHRAFLERSIPGNSVVNSCPLRMPEAGGWWCRNFRVEGAPTGFQAAQASAGDFDGGAFDFTSAPRALMQPTRAVAIAGGSEIAEFTGAIGQGGEHGVAVGNGFVAGELEGAGEGFCGWMVSVFIGDLILAWGQFGVRELCSRFRAVATSTQVIVLRKGVNSKAVESHRTPKRPVLGDSFFGELWRKFG